MVCSARGRKLFCATKLDAKPRRVASGQANGENAPEELIVAARHDNGWVEPHEYGN
jgi:hypothetical protein